jgi:hypothetical protein
MCCALSGSVRSGSPAASFHSEDFQELLDPCELTLRLDGFVRETIEEEASGLGVSADKLVTFAILYYLADLDSGLIARRISTSTYPSAGEAVTRGDEPDVRD